MKLALLLVLSVGAGEDFNRDIRPLLADRCFTCHGPDEKQRRAGLRLDIRDVSTKALESGNTAVVPGDADNSELIRRIFSNDPDKVMPPPDSGQTLSDQEKQQLKAWISAGAEYRDHWAFIPPKRPAVSEVTDTHWPRNEIDRFVLAKLERHRMQPSASAERVTLARRASLDLRGLPPTIFEVDAFVNDTSPQAWEKYVDRLLASQHYGERMAQDWLDLARYGDTNGYHADSDRTMWLYRDYVINSFNSNKPFDRFIIENMAGDLLPNATLQTRVASGFNRCNTFNEEGGADPDEFYVAYAIDRANTTGQVFLGLTIGCAQCHDHKYDPITQRDYYQLYAFFNSIEGEVGAGGPGGYHNKELPPLLAVPTRQQQKTLDSLPDRLAEVQREIETQLARCEKPNDEFDAAFSKWMTQLQDGRSAVRPRLSEITMWVDAADVNGNGVADASEEFTPEKQLAVWNDRSGNDNHAEALAAPNYVASGLAGLPAVRFDGIGHHMRTQSGGGDLAGDFTIVAVFRSIAEQNHQMLVMWGEESTGKRRSLWRHADGRFSFNGHGRDVVGNKPLGKDAHIGVISLDSKSGEIRLFLDGADAGRGSPMLNDYASERITIGCNNSNGEFAAAEISEIMLLKRKLTEAEHQQLGKYLAEKYSLTTAYGRAPKDILNAIAVAADARSGEQRQKLRHYFARNVYPSSRKTFSELNARLAELTGLEKKTRDSLPTTLVMVEKKERTPAYILVRGDFQQRGEQVQPDVPALFPRMSEDSPRDRLGLAHWLTDAKNPLVARVTVNRLWKQLFGTGLVMTAGDFGTQGEAPSHPELLDWLSVEFMEHNWNVKALQKKILMSATYQQSSFNPHKFDDVDPYNRLLSRGPRFRLSAEAIRDVALSVSGLMHSRVGGPSVKPYQPAGFYDDKIGRNWDQSTGADLYRRGLYTYWRRTTLYPAFQIFDAPSREFCSVDRPRTNTPLQALVLMNDPGFVEAARVFAVDILKRNDESTERLTYAFRKTVARNPSTDELRLLEGLISQQTRHFRDNKDAAQKLVGADFKSNGERETPELAAWTALASVLLNLDETVTRE